jgi:HemY protein
VKLLIVTLVVLVVAVVLALVALHDPGYVLIQVQGWSVEVSFVLLAIALVLVFLVAYLALRFLGGARRLPRRWRAWRAQRRERKAKALLAGGVLDLIEGRWERAEQRLLRYAGEEAGALGFLGAARAAQAQGAGPRRDRYLQLACKTMPNAEFALALAQSEMQLADGEYQAAAANLKRLHRIAPKNRVVLTGLMRLHTLVEDWERLIELLPALRKHKVVEPERARRLQLRAWIGLIEAPGLEDEQALSAVWRRAPAEVRDHEECLRIYVHRLLERGAGGRAEAVLREAIDRQWSGALVYLYGLVEGADPAAQLRRAEGWSRGRDNDPMLLLTLGRLSRRNGLWGKARQYLEKSVETGATPEAFNELAATLEAAGETAAALACYHRGMQAMEAEAHRLALKGPDPQRLLSIS